MTMNKFFFFAFLVTSVLSENTSSSEKTLVRKRCPPDAKKIKGKCIFKNTCTAGYAPRLNDGKCLPCGAGFYANTTEVRCTSCPAGTWSNPMSASCTGIPCSYGDGPKGSTSPDQAFCVESCGFLKWRDIKSCASSGISPENCPCSTRMEGSIVFWINVATVAIVILMTILIGCRTWINVLIFFSLGSLGGTYLKVSSMSTWMKLSPHAVVFTCLVPSSLLFIFASLLYEEYKKGKNRKSRKLTVNPTLSVLV